MILKIQFEPAFDPFLAFAARCTSSFPVAFEPMAFSGVAPVLADHDTKTTAAAMEEYRGIFRLYTEGTTDEQKQEIGDFDQRRFGDGGALDPRPFSYAIDQIRFRTARRPTQRKLLFVDSFPTRKETLKHVNFINNLYLQATGLPRFDTIRGEIETINASNRMQDRLDVLWEQVNPCGPTSRAYHHLRVSETTDAIARLLAHVAGFDPDSDECFFIRQVVRAWRQETIRREKRKSSSRRLMSISTCGDIISGLRTKVHNGRTGMVVCVFPPLEFAMCHSLVVHSLHRNSRPVKVR